MKFHFDCPHSFIHSMTRTGRGTNAESFSSMVLIPTARICISQWLCYISFLFSHLMGPSCTSCLAINIIEVLSSRNSTVPCTCDQTQRRYILSEIQPAQDAWIRKTHLKFSERERVLRSVAYVWQATRRCVPPLRMRKGPHRHISFLRMLLAILQRGECVDGGLTRAISSGLPR